MVTAGVMTHEEAVAAKSEPGREPARFPMLAAHLTAAAATAQPEAREIALTVDRRLQDALEKLATARATPLGNEVSVAILVADQRSGDILASVDQPGSSPPRATAMSHDDGGPLPDQR